MGKPRKKIRGHKRGCASKVKYQTRDAASKASCWRGAAMVVYLCGKCKSYHVGHSNKRTGYLAGSL